MIRLNGTVRANSLLNISAKQQTQIHFTISIKTKDTCLFRIQINGNCYVVQPKSNVYDEKQLSKHLQFKWPSYQRSPCLNARSQTSWILSHQQCCSECFNSIAVLFAPNSFIHIRHTHRSTIFIVIAPRIFPFSKRFYHGQMFVSHSMQHNTQCSVASFCQPV